MKMVHIEDFVHPDTGYQLNILAKYFVKFGHEVTIITAEMNIFPDYLVSFFGRDNIEERDKRYMTSTGVKIIRIPAYCYYSGRAIFHSVPLMRAIKAEKPEVIFVHGEDTNTGMWAIRHRKAFDAPLIFDDHMDEMASKNRLRNLFRWYYRHFVTPTIIREGYTVIRTMNNDYVEKCLGIPLAQAPWISLGSDTMLFHPDEEARKAFREQYGISSDAFVILFAGKMDESKGGQLLADLVARKIDTDREIVYLIIGQTVGQYGEKVEATMAQSPYRVLRFPTQKYVDLAGFYQAADLALMPKQCSLSFYDFNAAGVPVLAEDNGINVQRSCFGNAWTFSADSLDSFQGELENIVNLPESELSKAKKAAVAFIRKEYDYEDKCREYEQLILREYNKAHKQ